MYNDRKTITLYRHLEYERVYLPLGKVVDTPFPIQGDDMLKDKSLYLDKHSIAFFIT